MIAARASSSSLESQERSIGRHVNMVVECECGWAARGEEDRVVEAMQVHTRLIHYVEITREEVLVKAEPGPGLG
jgi:hypothetical protein